MSRTYMQLLKPARPALFAAALVSIVIPVAGFAQATPLITGPVDESHLVTLSGNTHPFAVGRYDQGPVDATGRMLVVFKRTPQQEQSLQQLLRDQQNPASPQYHQWLTPDAFGERFGIADSDLQTVSGYLQQKGFTIGKLSPGHMSLEISGSSEQVNEAFHTQIHRYSVGDNQFFANDRDPQIPAALAPVVAGIASLNNFRPTHSTAAKQAIFDPKTHTLTPLFTTATGGVTSYGVSPGDLAKIYTIPAQTKPTGTAPTIGVVSDSNVNLATIAAYNTLFDLGASTPSVIVDGEDPGLSDDALTTTEELELIGAVAPYASVNLYTSATSDYDTGLDFAAIRAVTDDAVNIIDFGFLTCESALGASGDEFVNALWEQAAAQGQTVISATGDAGAAACDIPGGSQGQETASNGPAVNGWASTPYNTAVGGTDFYYTTGAPATNYWSGTNGGTAGFTSAKGAIPQQPWNDSDEATDQVEDTPDPLYASGGGASSLGYEGVSGYPVPSWQTAELKGQATTRAVPDLSLFAGDGLNHSYYLLCFASTDCADGTSSTFTTAGGTAAAASVFAGVVAQVIQKYSTQGNINPGLYTLAASTTAAAFTDITNGSNYVDCAADCTNGVSLTVDGTTATYIGYPAGTGFDLASGIGTINATNLINNWPNINSETAPGTVTLGVYSAYPGTPLASGATITHGVQTYLSATVKASGTKPTPTGNVAILSTDIQAADKSIDTITLVGGTGEDSNGAQLPGGTYTLYARYAGDTNYAPATSSAFTITVNPEPSQVMIMDASAQPVTSTGGATNQNVSLLTNGTVAYGTPVRITVEPFGFNLNTSVGIPSGYISVLDKGVVITKIPLNSEGSATFQSNSLGVGSHSFTFSYGGDVSFSASTSTAATGGGAIYNYFIDANQTAIAVNVTSVATTTALSSTGTDLTAAGGQITLTAVVSSASSLNTLSAPTGQVQFKFVNAQGGVSYNYVTVTPSYDSNGNLVATASEVINQVGTYSANFVATGNYQNSTGNSIAISQSFCDFVCSTTDSFTTLTTVGGGTTYSSSSDIVFNIQVTAEYLPLEFETGCYTNEVSGSVGIYANGVQLGLNVALDPTTGTATFTVPKTGNYLDVPSGTVSFTALYNGGTATLNPANPTNFTCVFYGNTTFNTEESTATDVLTINGNSQGNPNAPKQSGDFNLQTLQTAQVMPAGTSGSLAFPLQLTATEGFAQNYGSSNISLTCLSSTPGLTCSLTSTLVGLSTGYGASTANIGVGTNYTIASDAAPAAPTRWWIKGGSIAMGCVLLLGLPARRRSWRAMLSLLFVCAIAIGMNGCGSNALNAASASEANNVTRIAGAPTSVLPGTGGSRAQGSGGFQPNGSITLPAGTYPITVTGTVTLNGVVVTHNTVFNVVVQ